jgi:hypothetical protein
MPDVRESLATFIRWVMRDVRYLGTYACTVQGQVGNLLDVLPDDEELAGKGLSGIPIKHGLPGFAVMVRTGARVLLAFENGDPTKPYVALWDSGSVISVEFEGGLSAPIARASDTVYIVLPYTPLPTPGPPVPFPVTGVIQTGRAGFLA